MRVIAGRAGGVRLTSPKSGVRPTMDRVKAAIFSSLGEMVIGARVLDLFAGTGALGIEALSRGAESALFIEEDRQSATTIEKNLTKTQLTGRVRQQDVFRFLTTAAAAALREDTAANAGSAGESHRQTRRRACGGPAPGPRLASS